MAHRGRVFGALVWAVSTTMALAAGCTSESLAGEEWTAAPPEGSVAADVRSSSDAAPRDAGGSVDSTPVLCTLTGPPSATTGDVLVFDEEFEGTALDPLLWRVADGYRGHGGIVNTASPENVTLKDGVLRITTDRDPLNAQYPYKSGHIETLGKYARTYGRIEIRARFPFAAGVWYALWGRPWSQRFPEIDIEIVNRPTKTAPELYFVNHWAAPPLPADDRRSFVMLDNPDIDRFRTYTILWKPDLLEWQLDGVTKMRAKPQGIPNLPVYWMINGWVGGWVGAPTERTPFPTTFEVDYVRVYRVDGLVADPVVWLLSSRTSYSPSEKIEVAIANFDEACAHVTMYDGDAKIRTLSSRPFRYPLSSLARGAHRLSFVATDGVRSTSSSIEVQIE